MDYGKRPNGTSKGLGYLGEIRMPDNNTVMTEMTIGVDDNDIPSITPGIHPASLNYLRQTGIVPEDLVATAVAHARKRAAAGLPAYATTTADELKANNMVKALRGNK